MTTTPEAIQRAADDALGPNHKLLYGIDEAGEMLGLGRSKLYELMAAGVIESVKLGKRRLIPAQALASLVAKARAGELE